MTDGDAATAASGQEGGGSADEGDGATYGGLLGAVPYAFRASDSRLFRSYAVVGTLLATLVAVLFALAIVVLLGNTGNAQGGTFTFSRAFFIVLMMFVVGPLIAPVLLVARRHRRVGSTTRYDAALAGSGYLFLLSVYLGLVISTPAEQQETPAGVVAPIVDALYALPQVAGVVPPVVAVGLMIAVHYRLRASD